MNSAEIEQLKAQHFPCGVTFIFLRRCTICETRIGYRTDGTDLFFDSNCACTTYVSRPEKVSWDRLVHLAPRTTDLSKGENIPVLSKNDELLATLSMIKQALIDRGFDKDDFALSYMVEDYRTNKLNLADRQQIVRYRRTAIVTQLIADGRMKQARLVSTALGVNFGTLYRQFTHKGST